MADVSQKDSVAAVKDQPQVRLYPLRMGVQQDAATVKDTATIELITPVSVATPVDSATVKDVPTLRVFDFTVPISVQETVAASDIFGVLPTQCRQKVTQVLSEAETYNVGLRTVTQILVEVEGTVLPKDVPFTDKASIRDSATIELDFLFSEQVDSATVLDVATVELVDILELPVNADSATLFDTLAVELKVDDAVLTASDAATVFDIAAVEVVEGEIVEDILVASSDSATITDYPTLEVVIPAIPQQKVTQVLTEAETYNVGLRTVTQVLTEAETYNVGLRTVTQILAEVEWQDWLPLTGIIKFETEDTSRMVFFTEDNATLIFSAIDKHEWVRPHV
jgi:hypothetical protein